jgi:hypothetical protein
MSPDRPWKPNQKEAVVSLTLKRLPSPALPQVLSLLSGTPGAAIARNCSMWAPERISNAVTRSSAAMTMSHRSPAGLPSTPLSA